jgi:hypothetical protein
MDEDILNINIGFIERDKEKIYSSLLSYVCNNKKEIRFQRHPLGFKYFKLGKISSTEELRLHFWVGTHENQDDDLQIHDHSFNFVSFVVFGCIKNTKFHSKYDLSSKGYIYDVKFRNEKSRLVMNSKKQLLETISSETIATGEFYSIESDELHKSENLNKLTISLLKITKPKNKIARVFSPKELNVLPTFKRALILDEENSKLLNKLTKKINDGKYCV